MPLIYRSMIRDGDRPKIGPTARTLGARIPGDISEHGGFVFPGTGGMSVARGCASYHRGVSQSTSSTRPRKHQDDKAIFAAGEWEKALSWQTL